MWSLRIVRRITIAAALGGMAVAVAAAQSSQAPPAVDPVVAEIRALRADLNERLEATVRMQLLVARLQLQEQRTSAVIRQLQDVEAKLRENETTKQQIEASLKMFGNFGGGDPSKEPELLFGPLRAGLEKAAQTEIELKQQQMELMRQVAQEQARWTAFNAQLDELERLFAPRRR